MTPEHRKRGALRSQCTGKRRYRDFDEAKRVRKKRVAAVDHDLRIYECGMCRGFHLTKEESR
jgi:hypothetical protein